MKQGLARGCWSALVVVLLAACSADKPATNGNHVDAGATGSAAGAGGVAAGAAGDASGGGAGSSTSSGSAGSSSDAGSAGSVDAGATDAAQSTPMPDLAALAALDACDGTITELFAKSAIKPPATGSGVYNAADQARRDALDAAVRALVGGDVSAGLSSAELAGYDVCRTDDDAALIVVVRPHVAGEGHALLAFRPQAAKGLIVEAPHAFHDADTELEAPEMFLALDARALVVSGTYRCASLAAGPCDGYTTACTGLPAAYTISDAAHNSDMLFQAAHVALAESYPTDIVASLHGMPDPGISVSNGTQMSPAVDSFQARLLTSLTQAFPADQVTTCQALTGATQDKRWCGSENVQGRHVNHAADVCAANATETSNRFVHVEQSRGIRDQRAMVIAAFADALH